MGNGRESLLGLELIRNLDCGFFCLGLFGSVAVEMREFELVNFKVFPVCY